ncbi:MAG: MBL fold metallo-hydrolase, partial [Patescibacteria group bacterium]
MDITSLGLSSFKLKGRTVSVVTDPYDSAMLGIKFPKVDADIVTISHDHPDHNKFDQVTLTKKIISGPGEYELGGVSVIGLPSFHDDKKGSLRGKNTIYVIEIDRIRIVHLGDLGHTLEDKLIENIGSVDILFIPTGGDYTIGPKEAVMVVSSLEPKIVIPMHYKIPEMKGEMWAKLSSVEEFVSQASLPIEKVAKFVIKKEDLTDE